MKKITSLLAGVLAVAAFGAVAQAETRLAVQDATGTVDKMVVTDQGRIGIGTDLPIGAYHAKGSDAGSTQLINQFTGTTTANGGGGFLAFHNNASGALPSKDDRLGYFSFGSYDGATQRFGAALVVRAGANWSGTSIPSYISFETAPLNSVARVERVRINSEGNVGIGTSGPTQKLEVNGGLRLNAGITPKPACDSTTRGTLWFTRAAVGTSTADTMEVCIKTTNDGIFNWRPLW